jgi:hypothetical protein
VDVEFPWRCGPQIIDPQRSTVNNGDVITLGAVLIGSSSTAVRAAAGAGQVVNLAVDDPRPVAKAVLSLISQYGYQITYEDPPYAYQGDLADRYVNGFKDRIPAGGTLNVSFTPSSDMRNPADMVILISA